MSALVVDTSLLYVLTAIERLDLLAFHKPLTVTSRARGEHAQHGTPKMNAYLTARENDGLVRVIDPGLEAESRALQAKYRKLSFTDANCLALSKRDHTFLLADDRGLLEAAEAEGVDWVDLSMLLFTCVREGRIAKNEIGSLVQKIEQGAHHTVRAATKRGLGL
jgi:predicted nucleic acid-binding protein